ncbi:MAG TPA: lipase maturation factor family protein [Terriglobia bacterium]|nr:lipase maturation factor family protein [Terriglobia bacterium]
MLQKLLSKLNAKSVEHRTSTMVFLRLLAAVYFIAFLSLWTQVPGLIGRRGILPAYYYLKVAHEQLGTEAYYLLPTLGWFNSSDTFWQFLCAGGALMALVPLAGVLSAPLFLLMWMFYLSLVTVARDFLAFQWDGLLLETGFLAVFLAYPRLFPKRSDTAAPAAPVLLLLWWLLFRLIFSSGMVKLLSGDPTWRSFTALNFHYETQPLPNAVSWFMHQLPAGFQKVSVAGMFVLELGLPFFIFAPRRLRWVACAGLVWLQLFLLVTGNYAFFNLLTIALCVLLLDEGAWRKLRLVRAFSPAPCQAGTLEGCEPSPGSNWPVWIILPLAVAMLLVTSNVFTEGLGWQIPWPSPVARLTSWAAPFCIANRYGLFAVMTTERPEIVLEGSQDGEHWESYEFKYKPGQLTHRPPFVAPHQPRLDWQMWFAALGPYQQNVWFTSLCNRLLQGSPEVLALLDRNPFPEAAPKFVRGVFYDYHFTDSAARRATRQWWRRELKGQYSPVMTLPERAEAKVEEK